MTSTGSEATSWLASCSATCGMCAGMPRPPGDVVDAREHRAVRRPRWGLDLLPEVHADDAVVALLRDHTSAKVRDDLQPLRIGDSVSRAGGSRRRADPPRPPSGVVLDDLVGHLAHRKAAMARHRSPSGVAVLQAAGDDDVETRARDDAELAGAGDLVGQLHETATPMPPWMMVGRRVSVMAALLREGISGYLRLR